MSIEIQVRYRTYTDETQQDYTVHVHNSHALEVGSCGNTAEDVEYNLGDWFAGLGWGMPEDGYAVYKLPGDAKWTRIDNDAFSYPRRLVNALLGK